MFNKNGGINIKKISITVCLIIFATLCFASMTGFTLAQKEGYTIEDFQATIEPTIDGKWTSQDEWSNAAEAKLEQVDGGDTNTFFRIQHTTDSTTGEITYYLLVEVLNDTTNDSGDLLQICIIGADEVGGTPIATTLPNEDTLRIDYLGHDQTRTTIYRGAGQSWSTETDYTWSSDILIVDSFDASPSSDNAHLIYEVKISASAFNINPEYWIRVATFDESDTSSSGMKMWPLGSREDSNDWGQVETIDETIPEFPTWTIIPIFAIATVVVTFWKKGLTTNNSTS